MLTIRSKENIDKLDRNKLDKVQKIKFTNYKSNSNPFESIVLPNLTTLEIENCLEIDKIIFHGSSMPNLYLIRIIHATVVLEGNFDKLSHFEANMSGVTINSDVKNLYAMDIISSNITMPDNMDKLFSLNLELMFTSFQIKSAKKLYKMSCSRCQYLELPEELPNLNKLTLYQCNLTNLPVANKLVSINFTNCPSLNSLDSLDYLEKLYIINCPKIVLGTYYASLKSLITNKYCFIKSIPLCPILENLELYDDNNELHYKIVEYKNFLNYTNTISKLLINDKLPVELLKHLDKYFNKNF